MKFANWIFGLASLVIGDSTKTNDNYVVFFFLFLAYGVNFLSFSVSIYRCTVSQQCFFISVITIRLHGLRFVVNFFFYSFFCCSLFLFRIPLLTSHIHTVNCYITLHCFGIVLFVGFFSHCKGSSSLLLQFIIQCVIVCLNFCFLSYFIVSAMDRNVSHWDRNKY